MKNLIPDMNDRELDDLFRKAAEGYSPAHQEEVWEKLEEKLDAPQNSDRRKPAWWIFLIAFLLLGTSGFLFWQYGGSNSNEQTQLSSTSSKSNSKESLLPVPKVIQDKQNDPRKVLPIPDHALPQNKTTLLPSNFTSNDNLVKDKPSGNSKFNRQLLPIPKLSINALNTFKQKTTTGIPIKHRISFDTSFHYLQNDTLIKTTTIFDTKKENSITKKDSSDPKITHWYFGLTVGPDWSSAGGRGWKIGVGGGLKLTYKLNNKWAFTTGVLLDKKLYDAQPEDYNPKDDSWRNYDVKNIDAQCIVWDIPLNVQYTLWNDRGNSVFLSTGLSSFWMHEEAYTYYYKTPSGSWEDWTKALYDQNHHIFSVLNFSAGYERSWKHFSLQAGPYIKLPLKGIGYGRVKLYSTGIHFTLQYGLK